MPKYKKHGMYFGESLARQLNYSKTLISPDRMIVHIPGGFHLESFDQKEHTIQLTSLMQLFESATMFAYWDGVDTRTLSSFWDISKLFHRYMFFIAYITCDISKEFYKSSSRKNDLDILMVLSNLGRTSFTLELTMKATSEPKPYARLVIHLICVDLKSRKPCPLPVEIRKMFEHHEFPKRPIYQRMENLIRPYECKSFPVSVYYTDTDENQHTHWTAYIRACYNACMAGILNKTYHPFSKKDATHGIKTFEIAFMKESMLGDNLDVFSWKLCNPGGEICFAFDVQKGHELCCQGKLFFHDKESNVEIQSSKL